MESISALICLCLVSLASGSNFRSWNVTVGHETCLLLQGKIFLYLDYASSAGGLAGPATVNVTSPTDQSLANCRLSTPYGRMIQIGWTLNTTANLTLRFSANASLTNATGSNNFVLTSVSLTGSLHGPIPNATTDYINYTKTNLALTPGFIDHSLLCVSGYRNVPIAPNFNLTMRNLLVQAFVNKTSYQAKYFCPADQEAVDVVPIVIGGVLAASVLAVTLGYLVVTARRTPEALDIQLPFEEELKKPAEEAAPSSTSNSSDDAAAVDPEAPGKKY